MLLKTFISTYEDKYNNCNYIRLFGINCLVEKNGMSKYEIQIAPIKMWFRTKASLSFKTTIDYLIEKYDSFSEICVFNSNLGETYLLILHYGELIRNLKLKNCIFCFNNEYTLNLFRSYFPNASSCYAKLSPEMNDYAKNEVVYKKRRIIFPFTTKYFQNVEKRIRRNGAHFYEILKESNKLHNQPNIGILKNTLTSCNEQFMQYIKQVGEKYIILCPESTSSINISELFWNTCIKHLRELGYTIFCNSVNINYQKYGVYSFFPTFNELQMLARKSQAILGLRSGLYEILLPYGREFHAIYTPFPRRGSYPYMKSQDVMQGFTLKKLDINPEASIYEYDYNQFRTDEELISKIITNLRGY